MEKLETSKTQLEENFNEQNLEFQLMKQELEELKDLKEPDTNKNDLEQQSNDQKRELQLLEKDLEEMVEKCETLKTKLDKTVEENTNLKSKVEIYEKKNGKKNVDLAHAYKKLNGLLPKISQLEKSEKESAKKIEEQNSEITKVKNEVEKVNQDLNCALKKISIFGATLFFLG